MTSPAHQVSGGLVAISGPLFDGRAPQILDDWMRANMKTVADTAEATVRSELDVVLRHPTGAYRASITSAVRFNRVATHDVVVTDSGDPAIYGPWLAGTGSRNSPRFRGYTHWRKAAQRMEKLAPQVMVATLRQLMVKLGG